MKIQLLLFSPEIQTSFEIHEIVNSWNNPNTRITRKCCSHGFQWMKRNVRYAENFVLSFAISYDMHMILNTQILAHKYSGKYLWFGRTAGTLPLCYINSSFSTKKDFKHRVCICNIPYTWHTLESRLSLSHITIFSKKYT